MNRIILALFVLVSISTKAQVGIGTANPDASAILDVTSTTKGMLIPKMTQAQRLAIVVGASTTGLLVYQTDATTGFWYYTGAAWSQFGGVVSGWGVTGTTGTTPATNKLGTTDAQPLVVKTNNTEALRILSSGNVGIGTTTAGAKLEVQDLTPSKSIRIEDGNQGNNFILTSDANGNAVWTNPNTLTTTDDDWRFNSGTTYTDPLYRTGSVQIGDNINPEIGTLLCIHNNTSRDTEFGWGDVEYMKDGDSEFFVSHALVPSVDNSISLGTLTQKWRNFWASSIVTTSDEREKEQIKPLTYGLSTLMKLNPVSYYWKKEQYGKTILEDKDKRKKIGFIAQELKEVLPETIQSSEWVQKSEKEPNTYIKKEVDTLGVCYSEILPVVIKSTQEHQQTLDDIKKQQEKIIALIKKAE